MTFTEYPQVAKKHLISCMSLFMQYEKGQEENASYDPHILIDLWYLSGYILEGITVYFVYKRGGWAEEKDIKKYYDASFTSRTGVDFFRKRSGVSPEPHTLYSIQGHGFQDIIKNLFRGDNAYDILPYFGNSVSVDPQVEYLIDNWSPELRYNYEGGPSCPSIPSRESIKNLILTCYDIFTQITLVA